MKKTFKENYGIYKLFRPLYDEGLNDSEIGRMLGCHNATVSLWRHRSKLPANFKRGDIRDRILQLYSEGLSRKEIGELGFTTYKYVGEVLEGIPSNKQYPIIKKEQKSIIIGTLLGDGWVNSQNLFGFAHKESHLKYLKYKIDRIRLPNKVSYREQYRGKTLCKSNSCVYHTHPYFKELRQIFYPEGKKIFPSMYLEKYINWESLAYWYLDDGTNPKSGGYSLSMVNFQKQAMEIKYFLESKFNLKVNIHGNGTVLYIPSDQISFFTKNISPYIPNCMMYKIKEVLNKSDKLLENPEKDNQQPSL